MNSSRASGALAVATCVAVIAAVSGWIQARTDLSPPRSLPDMVGGNVPPLAAISTDLIDSLATAISDHDPFRLSREPSTVPYAVTLDGAPPPPPPPPKPPLVLSGTVGPPWIAVLEGVPAHEGSLLAKVGDTVSRAPFALLTVRAIRHDTVVVRAPDSTWTLTVHRAWH